MNYPLISEYIEAIKSAEDNFKKLSYLSPVLGDDGLPVMTSGNFAVVFKMEDEATGKFYALKCFTKEQQGREEAYHKIAEELKDVDSPYLVSIRYFDKELFVDTEQTDETEFPVLLMDWVEGKTLDKYLRENLDDKYTLEMLAYRFSQLAQWLIPQPFAHGDLKPDNILVREDGTLVLVDYDGMYVPAMKGQKARELGSPDFCHPLRTETDFDEHIDDFSVIMVLLSLYCFSIDSERFQELCRFDGTLFHESDYMDLANSKAFKYVLEYIRYKDINRLYSALITVFGKKKIDYKLYMILFNDYQEKTLYAFREYSKWDDKSKLCFSCYLRNGIGCKKDAKTSADILQQMSEQNNPEAQLHLGYCFYHGLGVSQNYEKAVSYFMQSANQGYSQANFMLGMCYYKGHGVPQSYERAVEYYSKSADEGNAIALGLIGDCYRKGNGVPQNNEKAIECFMNASKQGSRTALRVLGISYLLGNGVLKNHEKAIEYFSMASQQGDLLGAVLLGTCYYNGWGVQIDYNIAVEYFINAAEHGVALGQLYLGNCYYRGKGILQSFEKAAVCYTKAAEQGNADAQCNLAYCYYSGKGVKQSNKRAFEWWLKSAEQGNVKAQYNLGCCYENEIGVILNRDNARVWYQQAAERGHSDAKKALERFNSENLPL